MFAKIGAILETATARQSVLTTASTFVNGFLGAGFYFLLARFLHSTQYGIFALMVAAISMLADVADFGSNQSLIRFIPEHKLNPGKLNQVINFVFLTKITSGLAITGIVTLFAAFISGHILGRPEIASLMPVVGLGVLAQLLFSFSTSITQAQERFWEWSGLFVATNATRIILIIILFTLGLLSGTTSVLAYIAIPFLGFLASLVFIKFKIDPGNFADINVAKIFKFNGWVSAFIVVASVGARVDTFLTGKLISLAAVGVYALANQVVSILPQLTGAIGAVTSPKYSSFNSLAKNITYTTKATYLTTGVAIASSLIIIPLGLLIFRFTGSEYVAGVGPMIVLLLAMCIFLVTSPIRDSILYFFTKPQFFFWLGIVHVFQTIALSYVFIPRYQIMGSALTVLLGQVLIAAASITYYIYACRAHHS